jgi:hypothetical protein
MFWKHGHFYEKFNHIQAGNDQEIQTKLINRHAQLISTAHSYNQKFTFRQQLHSLLCVVKRLAKFCKDFSYKKAGLLNWKLKHLRAFSIMLQTVNQVTICSNTSAANQDNPLHPRYENITHL